MANLGQLVVNLEANIAKFTSDMGRASEVTEQTMGRMNAAADIVKNVLGAVGVALSVDLLVSEANRAIGVLADLDDMAQKTGSSVETLSKLSKVAAFTGTEFGAVDSMVVKLSKSLNEVDEKGSKTAKALGAIGISTADIKDMDPAQVFVEITRKLQDYEDGGGKIALVNDLMGKSAADMLPFMNDVAESIDQFTGDSAEAAAAAAQYQNQLGLLKVKYDEMVTSIVSAALPATNAFLGALMDTKREANALTKDTSVDTWADDLAIGLARVADRAKLTVGTLSALAGSVKVVAADILTLASLTPANMAVQVAQGKNPLDDFRAMMAEREKILTDANAKWDRLLNAPINAIETETRKRISEQKDAAGLAALGATVGINGIKAGGRTLDYGGGGGDKDKDKKPKKEQWSSEAAADRMVGFARDETLAMQNTIDVTSGLIEADKKRFEEKMRQTDQITAGAENIRLSLMTDVEAEQFEHERAIEQLQAFGALKLENEMTANALIEAETARHAQAQRDMQMFAAQDILGIAQSSADQLYSALKAAGMEQTALGKAMFIAQKAIQVASIIVNTEVAAAAAQAGMIAAAGATAAVSGPAGPGILAAGIAAGAAYATMTRVMGYATAGLVAGTAIASAEGGYDIPAGVNPVTQLHEKEMVLPKAQAEVIRNLAVNGGGAGMKVTIVNQTTGRIDNVIEKQISPTERALIIQEAVAATASTLGDPNSKMSRSMARNLNVARTRS